MITVLFHMCDINVIDIRVSLQDGQLHGYLNKDGTELVKGCFAACQQVIVLLCCLLVACMWVHST
jgi:hypothetical protein